MSSGQSVNAMARMQKQLATEGSDCFELEAGQREVSHVTGA